MTQTRELVCISCPMGCRLTVTLTDGAVTEVTGNTCPRGVTYANDECVAPKRVVTTLARIEGTELPLPVKTAAPIPKECVFDCVDAVKAVTVRRPVKIGDVVVPNVCGTGVDVVATAELV